MIGGVVCHQPGEMVPPESRRALTTAMMPAAVTVVTAAGVLMSSAGSSTVTQTATALLAAELARTNIDEPVTLVREPADGARPLAALDAREGRRFVERLRGPFALALWDHPRRTLLLAVDRMGFRRLYYTTHAAATVFGSGPRLVATAAQQPVRPDPTAVYHYLNFGFVPAPTSALVGVRRLPPGHLLIVRDGRATIERYWDMAYPEQPHQEEGAARRVWALTEAAVREALDGSDAKTTGAFLSGGTDSSTVVGLMGRLTGERTHAFSIGFEEDRYNELGYAEVAARHFGAAHYTHVVTPDEALDVLPRLVDAFDEPFGNNSAIGTYLCARLAASSGMTRLLAGDGGDEIFGGNERYRTDRIFERWRLVPAPVRRLALEPLLHIIPADPAGVVGRARRYVRRANLPTPERFYSYEFFVAQNAADLLTPEFLGAVDRDAPATIVREHFHRVDAASDLHRLMYVDLKLTIGDNDLLKVTRTAELVGLDVGFPMLARRLVEFTGTLPASFKLRGLETRYLFKRAFRGLLPQPTLLKPKHGFGVPTSLWLRDHRGFRDLARDVLLSPQARQRGLFAPGALDGVLARHAVDTTPFYGDLVWSLLMLELWHRRHLDRGGAR